MNLHSGQKTAWSPVCRAASRTRDGRLPVCSVLWGFNCGKRQPEELHYMSGRQNKGLGQGMEPKIHPQSHMCGSQVCNTSAHCWSGHVQDVQPRMHRADESESLTGLGRGDG